MPGGSHQGGLILNEALSEGTKVLTFPYGPSSEIWDSLGLTSEPGIILEMEKHRANVSQMRGDHQKLGS